MELGPQNSVELKVQKLKSAITELVTDTKGEILSPFVSLEYPFRSRAKAKLLVSGSSDNPVFGLQDSEFKGIELENCPLHLPIINRVIAESRLQAIAENIIPYDVKTRSGELKGLIVVSNQLQTEVLVRFVLRSKNSLTKIKKLVPILKTICPEVKVITVNIQPIPHAILEGEEELLLTDEKYIWESYGGVLVAIAPQSFIQVTPQIAEKLYMTAGEWITELNGKRVLDLFCGIGGFSLVNGAHIEKAVGFEISSSAIQAANASCVRNGFEHLSYESRLVEKESLKSRFREADIAIVNPPRRGLGSELLEDLSCNGSPNVIYSSCNIETWTKDIQALSKSYVLTRVVPFDMFPLTDHFEILSLLKKI